MLQEKGLFKSTSLRKGDEIQKLNFIQTLPNLLVTDTEACITRVIPKVQQSLATASTEFHIAASTTFKTILEQKLVNHNVFSRTFLQSILSSIDKRDPDTIKTTIVPLFKKICESTQTAQADDNIVCVIAQEYGKIILGLEKVLIPAERSWFLKYYQQLAQMGIISMRKESKPYIPFMSSSPDEDEKYVECRRCCAYNLPAMFIFVSKSSDDTDALLLTFTALASDHYYLVRRTVACGIHEVAKVLGTKSGRIKTEIVKLLKDNSEEVLQGLVPNVALVLDCLAESQTIGADRMDSAVIEIGRALLKCESEIAATHNWRLITQMHSQLEILPKYFPSDFIYSYFVPMAFFRVLHSRPIPVRLSAGTLYLFLLRYNLKPMQRVELRSKLYSEVANNSNCYVRMMFVRLMVEAMDIFSSVYFKEHFFSILLSLAEDPVANIRLKVVSLLPQLKRQVRMPADKKLLNALESTVTHLVNSEKDRDVFALLCKTISEMEEIEVKHEARTSSGGLMKQDVEDARKLEEEKRLSGPTTTKTATNGGATVKKGQWKRQMPETSSKTMPQTTSKDKIGGPSSDPSRARIQAPWERIGHTNSTNICTTLTNVIMRENRRRSQQQTLLLNRDTRDFPTAADIASKKYIAPMRTFTAHYNDSCWPCSSMPEIPVMLSDDEFLVDAGIRIPVQFSQSMSKIPHLQDPMFGKRRTSFNVNRTRPTSMNFEKTKLKMNSSVEYEDCMKRRTNIEQLNDVRTSIDCEDGLRLVKENQHFKKDPVYIEPLRLRSRFGFVNQERMMEDNIKRRNSLILDKDKKIVQSKCMLDRTKRNSMNFDKGKPKRNFSAEYEDGMKRRTNGADQAKDIRLRSIDYEDGLSLVKENQHFKNKDQTYLSPLMRSMFGYSNQEKPLDDKMKRRNSLIMDKDKPKILLEKYTLDRTKRHSANFNFKTVVTKETKPVLKDQRSLDMTDYTPSERLSRAFRRYSTLDVNHNQGHSKIPLRSFVRRSRTAPATRASSPVSSQMRYGDIGKLCHKFEECHLY
ncbi:serine/threonine-protein phosphatase 4 regulatory subunit 4-like isoform X3 [Ceratina calcarata]|uniref:Serine/threonine-protein phosphatase 4 regulatory subunit 4-like isoform X3 n=1 Tax=Ceratina calcarata TaxID=156304 RepID=A0AAJ7J6A0_9HYME|nr:serine/threonine-protein phosphatase 4 regulatory subunit 4-like isoform X3 [Ceratina calcarata]